MTQRNMRYEPPRSRPVYGARWKDRLCDLHQRRIRAWGDHHRSPVLSWVFPWKRDRMRYLAIKALEEAAYCRWHLCRVPGDVFTVNDWTPGGLPKRARVAALQVEARFWLEQAREFRQESRRLLPE